MDQVNGSRHQQWAVHPSLVRIIVSSPAEYWPRAFGLQPWPLSLGLQPPKHTYSLTAINSQNIALLITNTEASSDLTVHLTRACLGLAFWILNQPAAEALGLDIEEDKLMIIKSLLQ